MKKVTGKIMKDEWKKVKLDDIAEFQYGYTSRACKKKVGPKFLRITDIVKDIIDWDSVPYCKISKADFHKFKLHKNDIVIARTGATAGYAKFIKKSVNAIFASYLIKIELKDDVCSGFVAKLIESNIFKEFVNKQKSGSAQPHANVPVLKNFEFLLPDNIKTQQKIASILSAYDELIENNNKRIKILEEMAQTIYKEWFVNFKFPGHENVKMDDSELGKIPERWEVKLLKEVIRLESGYAFKSKNYTENGEYEVITIKNVQDRFFKPNGENLINKLPQKLKNYHYLKTGDVLLSLTGEIGRVCFVFGEKYLLNQRVGILMPKENFTKPYIYFMFNNHRFRNYLEQISTGVAQQNLSLTNTRNLKILWPDKNILKSYYKFSNPIIQLMLKVNIKNEILKKTRDILLPKLMSGEIDVSDLDIEVIE